MRALAVIGLLGFASAAGAQGLTLTQLIDEGFRVVAATAGTKAAVREGPSRSDTLYLQGARGGRNILVRCEVAADATRPASCLQVR